MAEHDEQGAFEFLSNWRTFAPIAFTNLLLCIVTLGLYLFWARARERRFLWSNTRFIDARLEWTGTGLELLIGYVIALVLFGIPLGILQFGLQALLLRGYGVLVAAIAITLYLFLLTLAGVAIFRALRYRLSRTYWRGIRGGSDAQGLRYGVNYLWRTLLGTFTFGLMVPWSMVTLWNKRWNDMSFGPLLFDSRARYEPIFGRYMLFYLAPVVLVILGVIVGIVAAIAAPGGFKPGSPGQVQSYAIAFAVIGYILFFVVLGLIALIYYSAFFREAIGHLSLGGLEFEFTARTRDWLMLAIGNFALVIGTLGVGIIFLGYRNWTFFIRHMRAYGEVDLDTLTQSATRAPGQGEGLLDAFDVGAF